jgi:sugar/nucleoside kinase (ribokinase family)
MRSLDCLCAGIIVADQICEPLVQLPPPGGLALSPRMTLAIGGCAANVAADMARMHLQVGLSGVVGQDLYGREVARQLSEQGVQTQGLVTSEQQPTAFTFVLNVQGEDRRFIHCVGANAEYDGTQLGDRLLQSARVLYVGGYGLMTAMTPERLIDLFRRARASDVITVLDVVLPAGGRGWDWIAPVLPLTDYFFPNNDEAQHLTGLTDPWQQGERCVRAGAANVIVTAGAQGSVWVTANGGWRAATYSVPQVDATGAGDAFVSGFVFGLLQQVDPASCLRYGAAQGASCVQQLGATAGVLNAEQLRQYVADHPLAVTREQLGA